MIGVDESSSFLAWLKQKALPLWASNGWDERTHSFVERLSLRGEPLLEAPRRAMVQARQIYSYSVAHRSGWFGDGAEFVARAATTMIERYYEADGARGWAFSVARDGSVLDSRRDLYTHAFILLGLASAFETTRDPTYIAVADATLSFLDRDMVSEHGGYVETLPTGDSPRRQNSHMHLFEALLSLFDVTRNSAYLERAEAVRDIFFRRLVQAEKSVVVEFFDAHWQPLEGPRFPFEPGHHFEWIWLLEQNEELRHVDQTSTVSRLWETAFRAGVGADGRIFARATVEGAVDRSTRLWFYAEAAKAAHVMRSKYERFDCPIASDFLASMQARFLEPASSGSWIDEFDASGVPKVDFAPASSLYHICCAIRASDSPKNV
ncbi:mannose-6-phosphate isomerase (plasmid) [Methylosinus sp. C49]|uniref:AGE family epimerase/isomerase n=1 Tax=Methylosinus sp. C49 TaxID=2699395 RepID=UPI001367938C|nr:AGE family epimerase/isomerase [Methylosinus sp. C49]BBU63785.1 mannose-6-phosphate isomerase [Methylosinus sp. C49]